MFPCSPAVARAMVRDLETSKWESAVELGPGAGVLSRTLVNALPRTCRFLAVELSPALAAEFRRGLPEIDIVEGDAVQLASICRERDIDEVDAVFSALPLRLLSPQTLSDVLSAAAAVLRPGGIFAQVTYWPAGLNPGRQMREQVAAAIGPLESDRLVAGNTPPAWVFRCVKG